MVWLEELPAHAEERRKSLYRREWVVGEGESRQELGQGGDGRDIHIWELGGVGFEVEFVARSNFRKI